MHLIIWETVKSTEFKNPYEKNGTGGEKRENMNKQMEKEKVC